jgi:IMP dehydrogenase
VYCNGMQRALCFDDVLLVPRYSQIESRSNVDLSVTGFEETFARLTQQHDVLRSPIVGSPMDTVIGPKSAALLEKAGGFGVLHRYCSIEQSVQMYVDAVGDTNRISNTMVAIGATGDYLERATSLHAKGCRAFCIDVAHGHHAHVKNALSEIRKKFGKDVHIMSGNVSTLDAFNDLSDWGSDSIRVGIGGGSMCTTRIRTGHGVPTLQSIIDCARSDRDTLLVADGGIRNSGDIVKALAAGADMVMLGSLLAGHEESPGELIDVHGGEITHQTHISNYRKKFRGMASKEAQLDWRGKASVVEGVSTLITFKGKLEDTIQDLHEGIKSGLSYSGANNIRELRSKAQFVTITPNGVHENRPHGASHF